MKQVVQDQRAGTVEVAEVPPPVLHAPGVLVALEASVISSGTERAKVEMGERSLIGKARARPDMVRKVVDQVQTQGLRDTVALVRDRLGTPQPLGYSASGTVIEVGAGAKGLAPGLRVGCGGAGFANHAEVVYVPASLCAAIPDDVTSEQAAFATVASIALHGLRQATLHQGDLVAVSGLGLIGQLTVRLALAYGHPVVGVDPSPLARDEVAELGVNVFEPDDERLASLGADAVLLTAATSSDEPIGQAPTWCRDRGVVVVVGDVGLQMPRAPYYDREVEVRFSRSYGPGRYDPEYEEKGHDYPVGYVRWTEGRNLEEILRLLATGRLVVDDLITGRYPLERAPDAYHRLAHGDRARALLLTYSRPLDERVDPTISLPAMPNKTVGSRVKISVCGAGNFARKTLLPGLQATNGVEWVSIATATGVTASHVGKTKGFRRASADALEVATDPEADAVVIATRHDSHSELAAAAAKDGKFVFVEKPLAVCRREFDTLLESPGHDRIVTGFNRRWSPALMDLSRRLRSRRGPLTIQVRVNAGSLPEGHWADDPEQGGRVVGEMCHFLDAACFLADAPAQELTAVGSGRRAPVIEDTVQALLRYADGTTAAIAYLANGGAALPKERIELHWDGQSAVVDDFRRWHLFGKTESREGGRRQDKGHRRLLAEFVRFAAEGGVSPVPFHQATHVTDLSFAVIESMAKGEPVTPAPAAW
jgi:predicted dehydrogenase/NADPH:quinone reductase-like Zn-dependent oxidoreductase